MFFMAKVHEWIHGARTKALADEGLPTTRTPHSRVQTTKWAHPFYTLRYVTTSYGVWLTVEWIARCRFPRGRVERGSLKYPSTLGSYHLVSGINNESSKLVYHNKLWEMII